MPSTTYIDRKVFLGAADTLGGGYISFSCVASAVAAKIKSKRLLDIAKAFFPAGPHSYSGGDIGREDVLKAILYAHSKKSTKGNRQAAIATAKTALAVAGAVTGGTVGSIIPVAGTIAGAGIGAVAFSSLVTPGVRTLRGGKKVYKWIKGTAGKHREQCAACLVYNATQPVSQNNREAATLALVNILGDECNKVMHSANPEARIAARLKSN